MKDSFENLTAQEKKEKVKSLSENWSKKKYEEAKQKSKWGTNKK